MSRPPSDPCRRTRSMIQAHCAIRLSTSVGKQMRLLAGERGDIAALTPATLQTKFSGAAYGESLRLLSLAQYIKTKYARNSDKSGEA